MAGRGDIMAGRAYVELYVKNSAFTKALQNARDKLRDFGADMQAIGRQIAVISAAMLIPLALSAKTFASFDDEMRKVGARSAGTAAQLKKLRDVAKDLGATTSFTAVEVAALQAKVAQKGFDRAGIQAITADILNLARAAGEGGEGNTDTVTAADLVSGNLRAFSLATDQAVYLSDLFSAAVNNSNFSLEGLKDSLSDAAPIAKRYNVSVQDTVNVLAQMTNVNIDASSAGTAFRNILLKLSDVAGRTRFNESIKAMTGTTIEFVDASGDLRPLPQLLFEIGDALKGQGTAAQGQILSELFGLRAVVGGGVLTDARNGFGELNDILSDVGGTAKRTSDEMDSGLGGTIRILLSALEGVKIALGEAMEDSLNKLGKSMTDIGTNIRKWVDNNHSLVVTFAKVAVAIGTAGAAFIAVGLSASFASVVLGGFLAIINMTAFVLGGLIGAIAFLLSPLGLLSVAIVGIGVAFAKSTDIIPLVVRTWRSAVDKLSEMFGPTVETVRKSVSMISDAIMAGDLALAGRIAVTGLQLALTEGFVAIGESIGGIWGDVLKSLGSKLAGGDFVGTWSDALLVMSAVWDAWSEGVVKTFTGMASAIVGVWQSATSAISKMILEQQANLRKILNGLDVFNVQVQLSGVSTADRILGPDIGVEQQRSDSMQKKLDESNRKQLTEVRTELTQQINLADVLGNDEQGNKLRERLAEIDRQIANIGSEQPDLLGGAIADAERQIASTTDAINAKLDEIDRAAEAKTAAGFESLGDAAATGVSEAESEIERLRADLERLKGEAKSKREAVESAAATKGKGAIGGDGEFDSEEAAKPTTPVAVTSSAAGLIALGQGQGGSVQQQTLTEIRAMRKAAEGSRKSADQWLIQSEKMIRKLDNLGLGTT